MSYHELYLFFLISGLMFYSPSAKDIIYKNQKENDPAFRELCAIAGSSYINYLDRNTLQTLFLGLKFRTNCKTLHCDQCLSVERIEEGILSDISQLDIVVGLLHNALLGQECFHPESRVGNTYGNELVSLLEEIAIFYKPEFNHLKPLYIPPTLQHVDSEEILSQFILAIYKGRQILFNDETSKHRTVRESGEVINIQDNETGTPTYGEETTEKNVDDEYTTTMKYGYGTASVAIISALAFSGILFFPSMNTKWFKQVMQLFIALGVGTMSGDAILHIIPEVIGLHDHGDHGDDDEEDSFVWKLLAVLGGIWVLFLFENVLKFAARNQKKKVNSTKKESTENVVEENQTVTKFTCSETHDDTELENAEEGSSISVDQSNESEIQDDDKTTFCYGITPVALMIFTGDLLHNFGDGMAIGASFSVSWTQGIGTSLAIFCHELPHEFGDFAIYLNNGMSRCKALLMNFAAACCAFFGLYVGLALSENEEIRQWLLAVVAGMFLYISLVNVLHEMISEETDRRLLQFVVQNIGLLLGWTILFLIAFYEDDLSDSFT